MAYYEAVPVHLVDGPGRAHEFGLFSEKPVRLLRGEELFDCGRRQGFVPLLFLLVNH